MSGLLRFRLANGRWRELAGDQVGEVAFRRCAGRVEARVRLRWSGEVLGVTDDRESVERLAELRFGPCYGPAFVAALAGDLVDGEWTPAVPSGG